MALFIFKKLNLFYGGKLLWLLILTILLSIRCADPPPSATVCCNRKLYSICSRIAGTSLEPLCYNMGCKTECECLKSKWIG